MKLVLTSLLLLFLMKCDAQPDDDDYCGILDPVPKGTKPSQKPSPYFVKAVPRENNKVKVTISSLTEDFRGFVLHAISKKDPSKRINGEFTILSPRTKDKKGQLTTEPDTKIINCENLKNAWTNVDSTLKRAVATEWTPSPNVTEDVVFRAGVSKDKNDFWINLDSKPVNITNGIVVPIEEDETTESLFDDCSIINCLTFPPSCTSSEDCQVLLTYDNSQSGVKFSLHGRLDSKSYMAMGLSEDEKMGNDIVNECIRDKSDVIVRESWNEEGKKNNIYIRDLPKSDYQSSLKNGLSSCSWEKPYNFESNGQEFDLLNNNYYILLATGDVDANGKLKYHTRRAALRGPVNFTISKNHEEDFDDSDSEIDGKKIPSSTITPANSTATEMHGMISSTDATSASRGLEPSFNICYVILTLLFVGKRYVFEDWLRM